LCACRQKLQARAKELEKAKQAFLEEARSKKVKETLAATGHKEMKVGGAAAGLLFVRGVGGMASWGGGQLLWDGECCWVQSAEPLWCCRQPVQALLCRTATHLATSCLPLQAAEVAFRKAERVLEQERRVTETAEKAAAAAEKKLEK
jgi:hypothetical protein